MKPQVIVVTGVAGFIGSTVAQRFLAQGTKVIGIDNFSENYSSLFKRKNLRDITSSHFYFYKEDIRNNNAITTIFKKHHPQTVIHLAGLPGVRASLQNPKLYYDVNVLGTKSVFKAAERTGTQSLIFSSSSSVYGNQKTIPFSEEMSLSPLSPYAKTKKQAEVLLRNYHQKTKLPVLILRLFSVYGPRGRPDMAPYLFTQAALKQKKIVQFGEGTSARDYTYVDDITTAILKASTKYFTCDTINIGNSQPISLLELIRTVEKFTHHKILVTQKPLRPEEPYITFANIKKAVTLLKWKPATPFKIGMSKFVNWFVKNRN